MLNYLFKKAGLILVVLAIFLGCSKSTEEVGTPELYVSPDTLDFGSNLSSLPIAIKNSGVSTLTWQVTPAEAWISCNPDSGTNNDSVEVQVLRSQLVPGAHNGSVNVTSNAGGSVVKVVVTENPPPAPSCINVSKTSENYVYVSWCSVPVAHDYRLYKAQYMDAGYWTSPSLLATTSSLSHSDALVDQARWYRYQVSARKYGVEGSKTYGLSGYRKGCRLEDISIYDPTDGIGFHYDLYAYGYKNTQRAMAVYAVYKNGLYYYYVPGTGFNNYAAYEFPKTPAYDESFYNYNWAYIYDTTWDPNWRNNTYPQYINMRIYKSGTISSLGASYYDETGYWSITWVVNASGQAVPVIGEPVTAEKAMEIEERLTGEVAPGFSPSPHSGREGTTEEGNHHLADSPAGGDN